MVTTNFLCNCLLEGVDWRLDDDLLDRKGRSSSPCGDIRCRGLCTRICSCFFIDCALNFRLALETYEAIKEADISQEYLTISSRVIVTSSTIVLVVVMAPERVTVGVVVHPKTEEQNAETDLSCSMRSQLL